MAIRRDYYGSSIPKWSLPDMRNLAEAEALITQLELKNLELQADLYEAQIVNLRQVMGHAQTMGPMLEQKLKFTLHEIEKRQPKATPLESVK
jgi:hypothetical protein